MIALIVHMKVKPGTEEECKALMRSMEEHTRREPGCIQYVGHQCIDDPSLFSFYETFRSHADLDAHWASDHFKKYVTNGLDRIVIERKKELGIPVSE